MFQTYQNSIQIHFHLIPDGPLLVRAQNVGLDPGVADMEFQRTHRHGESTVFLAGSGLKGVVRSHAERLLRSSGHHACDPTVTRRGDRGAACGVLGPDDPARRDPWNRPHGGQCGACFTFGSTRLAGRFRFADAYPLAGREGETNLTEVRTGVGIDRRSQGAQKGVLYDTEVVVSGGFDVQLQGQNFTLWQAGLVLAALDDLAAGMVRIGGGKERGMGTVKVEEMTIELGFLDRREGKITGVQTLGESDNPYSLPEDDQIDGPAGGETARRGLFRTLRYSGETARTLARRLIDGPLETYLRRTGGR